MMMQNEYLLIEATADGAELMRIYDKKRNRELLWNGDPTYWKRRSPVLFPNVGKNWNNTMWINGSAYKTSQHGFARDRMFECTYESDDRLTFVLRSDEETMKRYPFAFELQIDYILSGKELEVLWTVRNLSDSVMPFTIGAHPAFRFIGLEDRKEDYCLHFPGVEELEYTSLDLSTGTAMAGTTTALPLNDGYLPLSDELFARDAIVLDNAQVSEAWLCNANREPLVGLRSEGFPNYGVWSVKNAPFVCLEPWAGRCDNCGFEDDYSRKPNVNLLNPGECFVKGYRILVP